MATKKKKPVQIVREIFNESEALLFLNFSEPSRRDYVSYMNVKLKQGKEPISPTKWFLQKYTYDYSITQISNALGISKQEVVKTYNEAMEKIVSYLKETNKYNELRELYERELYNGR